MVDNTADAPTPKARAPMWTIKGQPLALPPDFAVALAGVVVEWSRLDDAIESDLNWLLQFQVVADIIKEPPRAFNKKLEAWKRAMHKLFPKVAEYLEVVAHVVPTAKEIARIRNILVHGMWPLDNPQKNGKYRVLNMNSVGNGMYRMDYVDADTADLQGLTQNILDLAGMVQGQFMSRILHGHHGLLTGSPARVPGYQARPKPPKPRKL
jgi:hypothetical protein